MRYFEDITVGDPGHLGTVTVSREEIIRFGERYDPQPFHVDPEAAAETPFGDVIASGWHTASVCMRVLVEEYLAETAALGAVGVDELRWPTPVRPGDTLTVESAVLEKRPSDSDPNRGVVRSELTAENQDGEPVIRWVAIVLIARDPDG
ncbi:MAG: MaoC family dehydratase [Halobacteriaceae archaeon]